jgi:hypothetical protein
VTRSRIITPDGPRPLFGHQHINWNIVGKPDELTRLVAAGHRRDDIARMANCDVATVTRYARLFGLSLRKPKAQAQRTYQQRRALVREHVARYFYLRRGECRDDCPHQERCASGCVFEVTE